MCCLTAVGRRETRRRRSASNRKAAASLSPRTSEALTVKSFKLIFVAVFFSVSIGHAANWPGWRGDSSGVSEELDVPDTWSETENIVWKTRIPGNGYSSPIVWGDRIFVTSVTDGVVRVWGHTVSLALFWLLGLATLWWYVGHLRRETSVGDAQLSTGLARRVALVSLFVVAIFSFLFLMKRLRGFSLDVLPTLSTLLATAAVGVAILVGADFLLERLYPSGQSGTHFLRRLLPRKGQLVDWLESWFVILAIAAFCTAVLIYTVTDEYNRLPRVIWPKTFTICCLGLIAALGAAHRKSAWRLLAPAVVGAFLLLSFNNVPRPGNWSNMLQFSSVRLVAAGTVLFCFWLFFRWLLTRREDIGLVQRARVGPVGLLLLVAVYFFTNNIMHLKAPVNLNAVCVDRVSGEIRWITKVGSRDLNRISPQNSAATPTAITDGKYLFVHFGDAGTYGLDLDGNLLWQYRRPASPLEYGPASSPALGPDQVVVTHDTDTEAHTVALEKSSGEVLWLVDRTIDEKQDAYASPLIVRHGGREQVILNAYKSVEALDLLTGKEVWHFVHTATQPVATPVKWNDLIVVIAGPPHAPRFMGAIRLKSVDGSVVPELVWEVQRGRPEVSSPVAYEGLLYMVTERGIATCVDLETGEVVWRSRLPPSDYRASVLAADGKVFFTNTAGQTAVVAAGREFEMLRVNEVDGQIHSSLAVSQGSVFVRTHKDLYWIEAGKEAS